MSNNSNAISIPIPESKWLYWGLFINTQLLAVFAYVTLTDNVVRSYQFTLFGLIWVNVGVWVLTNIDVGPVNASVRKRAIAIAASYFGLLAIAGGLISFGVGDAATGARIGMLPPGWGPAALYSGYYINITLMPAYVIGYIALAYLVYAAVIDTAASAKAAVIGLFTCVSCSWPIIAIVASSLFGGGSVLAASALELSYELSTGVFLLTVGLLYWRPTFTSLLSGRDQ